MKKIAADRNYINLKKVAHGGWDHNHIEIGLLEGRMLAAITEIHKRLDALEEPDSDEAYPDSYVSDANDHLLSSVENFVGPMPPKSKIPISFDEKGITVSKDNKSLTFDPISKSISGRVERKLTPNLSIEGKGYSSKGHHKADVSLKGKF